MRRRVVIALLAALVAGFFVGRASIRPTPTPVLSRESVAAVLEGERDRFKRVAQLTALFESLNSHNAGSAAAAYEEALDRASEFEIRLLMAAWSGSDPESAIRRALTWPSGRKRSAALEEAARSWASHDAPSVQEFVEQAIEADGSMEDSQEIGSALRRGIGQGLILGTDTIGATQYLAGRPRGPARERATQDLVNELFWREGPEAVERWAEAVPVDAPEDYKYVAFRKAVKTLVDHDLDRTIRWLEQHSHTRYGQTGMKVLARKWGAQNPQAALEWIRSQPDDRVQRTAFLVAFREWLTLDLDAAQRWLVGLPWSNALEPAAGALARKLADSDPEEAISWAERIEDERLQKDTLVAVGQTWYTRDSVAAEAWLERNSLSEDARTAVRSAAREKRGRRAAHSDSSGEPEKSGAETDLMPGGDVVDRHPQGD